MGFSRVPMFFKDGQFYFSRPGIKVYCTRDDDGVFRYGNYVFEPMYNNPSWSDAIHYLPGLLTSEESLDTLKYNTKL